MALDTIVAASPSDAAAGVAARNGQIWSWRVEMLTHPSRARDGSTAQT